MTAEARSELPEHWLQQSLTPQRAHGPPLGRARLRAVPEDFRVDEELGFAPSGSGAHWLLQVRKRDANTEWVARELAKRARVRGPDVGFAGLKDRHAVATQWFSVPAGPQTAPLNAESWLAVAGDGYTVVAAHRHDRKLRRGALAGNRFTIVLRELDPSVSRDAVASRLDAIARQGVPNYFGPQRFGREAGNLRRALAWARSTDGGAADSRRQRSDFGFALSAARSLIFNALLQQRVRDGSWNRFLPGDIAQFDDGATVFAIDAPDATLAARLAAGEIHPTGPLWGVTPLQPGPQVAAQEAAAAAQCAPLDGWLTMGELRGERRALRLLVRDLQSAWDEASGHLTLNFRLQAGAFATTVLSEIFETADC